MYTAATTIQHYFLIVYNVECWCRFVGRELNEMVKVHTVSMMCTETLRHWSSSYPVAILRWEAPYQLILQISIGEFAVRYLDELV